jgi:ferredoxin
VSVIASGTRLAGNSGPIRLTSLNRRAAVEISDCFPRECDHKRKWTQDNRTQRQSAAKPRPLVTRGGLPQPRRQWRRTDAGDVFAGSSPDVLLCSLSGVTYVIAGSCIKDDSCIEVCPVDCIHPKPGAPDFESAEQLYIDPAVCIDCDACVEACPVDAIFPEVEVPEKFAYALELNAEFFVEHSTAERTAV